MISVGSPTPTSNSVQVAACAAAALNAASWPFFGVGILDLTMSEGTRYTHLQS